MIRFCVQVGQWLFFFFFLIMFVLIIIFWILFNKWYTPMKKLKTNWIAQLKIKIIDCYKKITVILTLRKHSLELPLLISSVSICDVPKSDLREKSYDHFNLLRASVFNYERLNILRDSFGHPSNKLLSLDFCQSFCSEFQASRYTMGHNRTSE